LIHVVDTHALVRHLESAPSLGRGAREVLSDPESFLIVPTIVLAEARYMSASRKLRVSWEQVLQGVLADDRFAIHDLTIEVLREIDTRLEMHDAIICATALLLRDALGEEVAIITRDKEIRAFGLVQTIW
jgi:predicted nucleic acid-binding protein